MVYTICFIYLLASTLYSSQLMRTSGWDSCVRAGLIPLNTVFFAENILTVLLYTDLY